MVDNEPKIITCSNPDCRVGETNKCVEGLEFEACPNYGKAVVELENTELDNVDDESLTSTITLPAASKLSSAAATQLLRQNECNVIAIIGPHDAGKTSLIASMYDLFQEGPVNGVEFASSSTLHAFELACHDARAASQRAIAHSERTHRGSVEFYHLGVRDVATASSMTLILGDRAGEEYREVTDNVSDSHEFCEVARADTITILVDGERLLDLGERHNVRIDIELIVQALIEAKIILRTPKVALVLTKIDSVNASPDKGRVERDFDDLLKSLISKFNSDFTSIESFKVSASPKHEGVKRGTGLPQLLNYWLLSPENQWPVRNLHLTTTRMIGRLTILED